MVRRHPSKNLPCRLAGVDLMLDSRNSYQFNVVCWPTFSCVPLSLRTFDAREVVGRSGSAITRFPFATNLGACTEPLNRAGQKATHLVPKRRSGPLIFRQTGIRRMTEVT